MVNTYRTIAKNVQASIIEKKSKFIATVCKVTSVEEADCCMQKLRKQYYDASHHCFAYQIGEKNDLQRSSDDGEPQGTAGKPILEVLQKEDLKNTLICVTRYFGGTLLGTGGLIRAYTKAAKEGILAAGIVEKQRIRIYTVTLSYTMVGKVQYLLGERKYTLRDSSYLEDVSMQVEVPIEDEGSFSDWLINETAANVSITPGEYELIDRPV